MSATKNQHAFDETAVEVCPVDRAELIALFMDAPPHVPTVVNPGNIPIVDPFDAWGASDEILYPDEDDLEP